MVMPYAACLKCFSLFIVAKLRLELKLSPNCNSIPGARSRSPPAIRFYFHLNGLKIKEPENKEKKSAFSGKAFARLERNNTFLRGTYPIRQKWTKINMKSGEVKEMTIKKCRYAIILIFSNITLKYNIVCNPQ